MTRRLEGQVAWVTGGGRGIGRAIALVLARDGAAVMVSARSADEVRAVAREVEEAGGRAFGVECDVTGEAQVRAAFAAGVTTFQHIDILINNVGIRRERAAGSARLHPPGQDARGEPDRRSVALEVAAKGITINAVCPGWVDAEMTAAPSRKIVERTGRSPEDARHALESMNMLGRLIRPGEVAAVGRFLADPDAAAITWQAYGVDGGEVMA